MGKMVGGARSDEVVILPAAREDAPALHAMLLALGAAHNREEDVRSTPDDIARYGFGPSPAFEALIARRNEDAVGFAAFFYEFSTWRGCRGVYLQDLYVQQSVRGSGVGRRLLAAVVARARAHDARYMRLAVHTENENGMEFYRRLAFVEPDEKMFVLEGPDFAAIGRE